MNNPIPILKIQNAHNQPTKISLLLLFMKKKVFNKEMTTLYFLQLPKLTEVMRLFLKAFIWKCQENDLENGGSKAIGILEIWLILLII